MRYTLYFLILLTSCYDRTDPDVEIPFSPVKVRTATVSPKLVGDNLTMTGMITNNALEIRAETEGRIKRLYVTDGDIVKVGDTLLSIENEEVRIASALAAASYERIRLHHESERLGYDTRASDTVAHALEYISGLQEARLNKDLALLRYSGLFVTARSSGVISGMKAVEGSDIDRNKALGVIIPASGGVFRSYFLESEWGLYRKGLKAMIRIADGRILPGVLTHLTPSIDDKGRYESYWRIDSEQYLPPGMSGTIQPQTNKRHSFIIPATAIGGNGKEPVIFSVVSDTARWNSVELKWYNEDSVEVVAGLRSGMRIILAGHSAVHDGTPVEDYSENSDRGNTLSVSTSNLP